MTIGSILALLPPQTSLLIPFSLHRWRARADYPRRLTSQRLTYYSACLGAVNERLARAHGEFHDLVMGGREERVLRDGILPVVAPEDIDWDVPRIRGSPAGELAVRRHLEGAPAPAAAVTSTVVCKSGEEAEGDDDEDIDEEWVR